MKKLMVVKSTLCLGVAIAMLGSTNITKLSSATVFKEVAIAGISLSLDQYYSNNIENLTANTRQASALSSENSIPFEEDTTTEEAAPEKTPDPVSEYANVGISIADNFVNIRSKADTESKILGKLYKGSSATILDTKGDWVKIESGNVKGYIKSEFLAIGFSAEELVDTYGTKWAIVNTTTLKVREKKSLDSTVLTLIPIEEEFEVIKELDEWVKILIDEGDEDNATKGYVSNEYVDIRVEFEHAISIEEEEAKIKAAEEAQRAEEEAAANLAAAEARKRAASQTNNNTSNTTSNNTSNNSSSNNTKEKVSNTTTEVPSSNSGSGSEIASFALKFVGNPYVWGGTSLTNGADCSGFVQTVFSKFGISIPRTSSSQSGSGTKINVSSARAGDLVFYASNGSVNHVALCIGGGQVVHASNRKTGIKVSNMYYRTPNCARRYVN